MGRAVLRLPSLARVRAAHGKGAGSLSLRSARGQTAALGRMGRSAGPVAGSVHRHGGVRLLSPGPLSQTVGRRGEAHLSPGPVAAGFDPGNGRTATNPPSVPLAPVLGRLFRGLSGPALQHGHLLRARAASAGDLDQALRLSFRRTLSRADFPGSAHRPRRHLSVPGGHPRQPGGIPPDLHPQGRPHPPFRLLGGRLFRGGGYRDRSRVSADRLHGELRRPDVRGFLVDLAGAPSSAPGLDPGLQRGGGTAARWGAIVLPCWAWGCRPYMSSAGESGWA